MDFFAEEDRRERRRKLGLPEAPTEEEKARAEAAAAEKAKQAQAGKLNLPVKPVSGASVPLLAAQHQAVAFLGAPPWLLACLLLCCKSLPAVALCMSLLLLHPLHGSATAGWQLCCENTHLKHFLHMTVAVSEKLRPVLVEMKKAYPGEEERAKTAWTTMMKYIGNIVANPSEEKFRKIRLSNAAFQTRVGSITGSFDFLTKIGFQVSRGDGHCHAKCWYLQIVLAVLGVCYSVGVKLFLAGAL